MMGYYFEDYLIIYGRILYLCKYGGNELKKINDEVHLKKFYFL